MSKLQEVVLSIVLGLTDSSKDLKQLVFKNLKPVLELIKNNHWTGILSYTL